MSKQYKILVVDDDEGISEIMKTSLEANKKYSIDVAHDGDQAIEKILKDSYDLLLLDIMMPNVSGMDVCQKMIEDDTIPEVPVIMVSALPVTSKAFQKSQAHFAELKMIKDVIEKPFDIPDFLSRVEKVLG